MNLWPMISLVQRLFLDDVQRGELLDSWCSDSERESWFRERGFHCTLYDSSKGYGTVRFWELYLYTSDEMI